MKLMFWIEMAIAAILFYGLASGAASTRAIDWKTAVAGLFPPSPPTYVIDRHKERTR